MVRCPRCEARKGRRPCPALETEICSICCGTERLRTIDCPDDCSFLGPGQRYQLDKRRRRGAQRGREYLRSRRRAYPRPEEFAYILALEARAYLYLRDCPGATSQGVWRGIDAARDALGSILVPQGDAGRNELTEVLLRDLEEDPDLQPSRGLSPERRRGLLGSLAGLVRRASGEGGGGGSYLEMIRPYFQEILGDCVFEPASPQKGGGKERRTQGGIILP